MPSQLANCVIEVGQSSTDYTGYISLMITVIGWPVVFFIGRHTNKNLEINKSIDALDTAIINLREKASLVGASFKNSDYLTMIAMFNHVKLCCSRIEQLDKDRKSPSDTLRALKRLVTDNLFEEVNKDEVISKILTLQYTLNCYYKKSI